MLTADGNWQHQGELATHRGVTRFFHQQIRKDERGAFFLVNQMDGGESGPPLEEHVYFNVEDTAYFVWQLRYISEDEGFELELNTGARVPLELESLTQDEDGNVYCQVLDGDEARFGRHCMTQLEPYLAAEGDEIVLVAGPVRAPFRPRG